MTAKFNELGAKGLLLNTLPLDSNLDLLLESKPVKREIQNAANNNETNNEIPKNVKKIVKGKI
jgi:hypothetical protein